MYTTCDTVVYVMYSTCHIQAQRLQSKISVYERLLSARHDSSVLDNSQEVRHNAGITIDSDPPPNNTSHPADSKVQEAFSMFGESDSDDPY